MDISCVCVLSHFSCVQFCPILWTVAHQAPLSMGFYRQEYWSGSPCPPPGDLPNPGIEPVSLMSPALAGGFFTTSATWGALQTHKDGEIGSKDMLLKVIIDTLTHPVSPPSPPVFNLSQHQGLFSVLWQPR